MPVFVCQPVSVHHAEVTKPTDLCESKKLTKRNINKTFLTTHLSQTKHSLHDCFADGVSFGIKSHFIIQDGAKVLTDIDLLTPESVPLIKKDA